MTPEEMDAEAARLREDARALRAMAAVERLRQFEQERQAAGTTDD